MNSRFFSLAHDMLCVATVDGAYKHVNSAWTRVLGWRVDELTGRRFDDFMHPDDLPVASEHLETLVAGGAPPAMRTIRLRARDGSYRWIDWRSTFDRDENEVLAAGRDVTDEVETRGRLATRERLLTELVAELAHAREEETARIAAELHDTAVQHSVAALMFLDEADAPADGMTMHAREQVRACLDDLRRVMSGMDPIDAGRDLGDQLDVLAREVAVQFRSVIQTRIEVPDVVPPDVRRTACKVVHEGLVNASKHAARGPVELDVRVGADDCLEITVRDGGPDTTQDASNVGTGRGLILLEARVVALGGSFQLDMGTDGTVLRASLPLSNPTPVVQTPSADRATQEHAGSHG